jgi:hypothetical protein
VLFFSVCSFFVSSFNAKLSPKARVSSEKEGESFIFLQRSVKMKNERGRRIRMMNLNDEGWDIYEAKRLSIPNVHPEFF